jgi:hypothetical protein
MAATAGTAYAESTWVYAVQLTASVQENPARITLNWKQDPYGATQYTVYRKAQDSNDWGGAVATLDGLTTRYVDTNVSVGGTYEYQVVKAAALGYTGYGYIFCGIRAPMIENRGRVLLVAESSAAANLPGELNRLQSDLIGDGWFVTRAEVSSNDTPAHVHTLIQNAYYADGAALKAVFLIGAVPVLQSGNLNYDTHGNRPMAADSFYGYMNNDWSTVTELSPSYIPSDVHLMVGRVDFSNMPGMGAFSPWPGEMDLLRNYLDKDHRWRHKQMPARRMALMGDSRGTEGGEAVAATGYRAFDPLVGATNTVLANVNYEAPDDQRWISLLSRDTYLLAYGCGGGAPTSCGGLGTTVVGSNIGILTSYEVVAKQPKAAFTMLFGSWFAQWDLTDAFMKAFLTSPTLGLTCSVGGRPHWFIHHMAMGEPIGYSVRLAMNNLDLYRSYSNGMARAVYVSLLGDPTLRMEPIEPPGSLVANQSGPGIYLSWHPSPDATAGYHVYRGQSPDGPFVRLTDLPVSGTAYSDTGFAPGANTYMVRAIALQINPSGSYYNPSQGVFANIQASYASPVQLTSTRQANGLSLTWNSQPGTVYKVQAADDFTGQNWSDVSGSISATGSITSWLDSNLSAKARFYRVITNP